MNRADAARAAIAWLNNNSGAAQTILAGVQAALATALAAITGYYAYLTNSLLKQARRSARAALRQADAAETTIAFARQQLEEQLGLGPQKVLEAIDRTQGLIQYWKLEARGQSPQMPNPVALGKSSIPDAIQHARMFSTACAGFLVKAEVALRNAQFELEKFHNATKTHFQQRQTATANRAADYLDSAALLLNNALAIVQKHIEERKA